jgi:thiol:disulfide interchange protein DsbD
MSGGLVGAFFMAVTLALTSFSCSVPFLAIMFSRFDKGDHAGSVAGLLAYSVTVALPFFLCSLFPALLRTLPKSGGWLNAVKVTMGFVELALAFKFLRTVALNEGSDVLSDTFVLAIWVACALGAALYLFGYVTLPHDTKTESIGVIRLLFALLFLAIAFYLVPGMFGRPLAPTIDGFLQRDLGGVASLPISDWRPTLPLPGGRPAGEPGLDDHNAPPPKSAHIEWPRNDWDGALARAAEKKRPALFDFTGVG